MSKIICDVCGTSYPETATQCPICGCVRSGEPITVAGDTNEAEVQPAVSYTYVKGGRFSKANVKKRNSGKPVYNAEPASKGEEKTVPAKKSEKGLIVTVIVLLLAIAAVVIYIACSFFDIKLPFGNSGTSENPSGTTEQTQQTTEPTETTELQIPCDSLEISDSVIEFGKAGAAHLLNVDVFPENQTDEIVFSSADEEIANVDQNGKITAVGAGQTVITVQCGEQVAECRVVCNIPEETTAPTVTEETYTQADLTFADNGFGYEYTIDFSVGSYNPYNGNIPAEYVTFTGNDDSVATVSEDGVVTFVGKGRVIITAKYNDWEIQCIIRII